MFDQYEIPHDPLLMPVVQQLRYPLGHSLHILSFCYYRGASFFIANPKC